MEKDRATQRGVDACGCHVCHLDYVVTSVRKGKGLRLAVAREGGSVVACISQVIPADEKGNDLLAAGCKRWLTWRSPVMIVVLYPPGCGRISRSRPRLRGASLTEDAVRCGMGQARGVSLGYSLREEVRIK